MPWSKSERITVDNATYSAMFAILTGLTVQRDVAIRRAQNVFLEMSDFEGTCEVIGILKEGYM